MAGDDQERQAPSVGPAVDVLLAAVRAGPEAVFLLDPTTAVICWVSERVTDLAGWLPEQMIGRPIHDFDPTIPDETDLWPTITQSMPAGQVMAFSGRFRCLDGTERPLDVRLTRLDSDAGGVVVAVARDVEARLRIEERLSEREATLTAVIGALRDGVLVVDPDGIVTMANPRAAELAGMTLNQIIDRPVTDVLELRYDEDGNAIPPERSPLLHTLSSRQALSGLVHGVRGDHPRWLLVNTAPIIDELTGDLRGAVATNADITDLITAQAELEELAARDPLTDLPNRGRFQQRLEGAVLDAELGGHQIALLFLDLDGFKTVNDSLGHSQGDELLRIVGRRLRDQLRPQDFIARIGGDEFVVLLPRLPADRLEAVADASEVAGRIVEELSRPIALTSQTVRVSASIGIAMAAPGEADAEEVLRQADLAMYDAKEAGRGAYRVFDREMDEAAQRTIALDGELRHAVERGELELHLQPRVEVATGLLSGAEALLRWPAGCDGDLDTAAIVAAAERNGLIHPIGRYVLGEACSLASELSSAGVLAPGATVSVNVSVHQLKRPDFVSELAALLDGAGLPPGSITVELTESALVHDLPQARRRVGELASIGVPMAIDDFGTGYSSLAYLRDLPVRELKLDRSFIADLGRDPVAETIVEGVIGIAQRLGIDTVAEGVERDDQLTFLQACGCTYYQGFLTSPALPPDVFRERYAPS